MEPAIAVGALGGGSQQDTRAPRVARTTYVAVYARITPTRDGIGRISRLTDAIAQIGLSPAVAQRLRQAEGELERVRQSRLSRPVTPLRSALNRQVRALLADLNEALKAEKVGERDALRALLGDIQLVGEDGATYAECDKRRRARGTRGRRRVSGSVFGGRIGNPAANLDRTAEYLGDLRRTDAASPTP